MTKRRKSNLMDQHVVLVLLHKNDIETLAHIKDPGDPISARLDLENDLECIERAMENLSELKRERIELYLFSGLNQTEQANHFNTSQPNVKRDFRRALSALIRLLE